MADSDLKSQLEELRAQVAAMTKKVDAQDAADEELTAAAQGSSDGDATEPAQSADGAQPSAESSVAQALHKMHALSDDLHIEELADYLGSFLHDLGRDVKDSKPRALVSAFVLGMLTSKVLSK